LPLFAEQGLSNVVWQDNSNGLTYLATQEAWYYYQAENEQGCQIISDSVYVSISPLPEAGFDYMQQSGNYAVDFSAINPEGASVNWIFHNGEQASGEEVSHTYPFEGFYAVTVIFKNQCGNDTLTQTIEVEKLLSINNLSWQIAVYPNPFLESFVLHSSEALTAARLYDLQGSALPLDIEIVENTWHIRPDRIAKGMYLLALEFRNQIYYHKLYKD
jgi:PKD repeat protein